MARKPDYGIDAPKVIRNLIGGGLLLLIVALVFPRVTIAHVEFLLIPGFLWSAGWMIAPGVLMLIYAKVGKFRHRDRILDKVSWRGDESVLDVGTGRGLLLISAAKRLSSGHATGIDIWNAEDLSGNRPDAVLENIALEEVGDKTSVKSEDAREMTFADASFDVVVSNLCLHNIYDATGRGRACEEIGRVLKPGGAAIISDFRHMREYEKAFRNAGLGVEMFSLDWTGTFPPLRILKASKQH